jgi:hypothetical protein
MLCFYKICAYVSSIVDIIFRLIHILLYLPCYDGGCNASVCARVAYYDWSISVCHEYDHGL